MPKDTQADLTERAREYLDDWFGLGQWPPVHRFVELLTGFAQSERETAAAETRRAALEDSPILSKYHGARGFEVERFIADYLAYRARLASPAPQEEKMNEDQIKHMVQRFLSWPLPKDFAPDGGITAKRPNYAPEVEWAPSGTNLLTATQAEAMVRHMLEGCP